MPSYQHKQLLKRILSLSAVPKDADAKRQWLTAAPHLAFLLDNAHAEEILIHTQGSPFVVNSLFAPADHPDLSTPEGTLSVRDPAFLSPSATYVTSHSPKGNDIFIETTGRHGERSPVFLREYNREPYWEIQQDYAHLASSHYRPEDSAYCRFDDCGDVEHVASVTQGKDSIDMVSFLRKPLDEYLAVSGSVLVRAFSFTFRSQRPTLEITQPDSWEPGNEEIEEDGIFAFRIVNEHGISETWGAQVVRPTLTKAEVLAAHRAERWKRPGYEPVDFIVHDFRNDRISTVSTHPSSTVTYFQAEGNDLPFETSPAFFAQEVLSKYKQDREKYTLGSSSVECRGGWRVRYDRNDEEQVCVILHDLRMLPHKEQSYWKSFNEKPKGGLSQRAIDVWYRGRPSEDVEPLDEIRAILWEWHSADVSWWRLGSEDRLNHVSVPSQSRKDWAESFSEMAKLINEGFRDKALRSELKKDGIPFEPREGSLSLLEKLVRHTGESLDPKGLQGLRTVQEIRSKAAAHRPGKDADALWSEAQAHDSPSAHFRAVCHRVKADLKAIDRALDSRYQYLKQKYG